MSFQATKALPVDLDEDNLVRRALAAYYKAAAVQGGTPMQPSKPRVARHESRCYVVLESVRGTLAVYRVRTDGVLKGLKRWPAAVAEPGT